MISVKEALKTPIFFEPDEAFIHWLIEYANGRIIFDIGAGTHLNLTLKLHEAGYSKLVAIEPQIDVDDLMEYRLKYGGAFHVLPGEAQRFAPMFQKAHQEPLLIFARPCHNLFVQETLNLKGEGVEALYITVPQNLKQYDDLGMKWRSRAKKIKHEGTSKEKEVVYSIK